MKKDKLYNIVAEAVQVGNIDKQQLAVDLMTKGASLAMVNREMPKALAANGITADVSAMSVVRETIREEREDGRTILEYEDVTEWANELSENFHVTQANCIKAIQKALGEDAPVKPKLGKTKQAIIAYLIKYPKGNISGLAEYLVEQLDMPEEKALRDARMNYSFAKACFDAS